MTDYRTVNLLFTQCTTQLIQNPQENKSLSKVVSKRLFFVCFYFISYPFSHIFGNQGMFFDPSLLLLVFNYRIQSGFDYVELTFPVLDKEE